MYIHNLIIKLEAFCEHMRHSSTTSLLLHDVLQISISLGSMLSCCSSWTALRIQMELHIVYLDVTSI